MAVLVDLICSKCGVAVHDRWSDEEGLSHCVGGRYERLWTVTRGSDPGCKESDKCVVYVSAKEGGAVQFPALNNQPVPDRLRARGYERQEITPRQMRGFERKHNVIHSAMSHDRGSGREYN